MSPLKIIYFNIETIDSNRLEQCLATNCHHESHLEIKPGLLLVRYIGTAKDLFESLGDIVNGKSIFIYDLDTSDDAFWGYMNKAIWNWVKSNR